MTGEAYLGKLGSIFPVDCTSKMTTTPNRLVQIERTVEGKNKAQVSDAAPRKWSVELDMATPTQMSNLQALADGEYGIGPFVWASEIAQVTNLCLPKVSTCHPSVITAPALVRAVGPLGLGDGTFAGRSYLNKDPSVNMYFGNTPTPVLPGEFVTGSAYLVGANARASVAFYTAAGGFLSAHSSTETGVSGAVRRLSVTVVAPSSAAYCLIYGTSTEQGARPAVTWTDQVLEWGIGAGASKVVLSGISEELVMASNGANTGRFSNSAFEILEVG